MVCDQVAIYFLPEVGPRTDPTVQHYSGRSRLIALIGLGPLNCVHRHYGHDPFMTDPNPLKAWDSWEGPHSSAFANKSARFTKLRSNCPTRQCWSNIYQDSTALFFFLPKKFSDTHFSVQFSCIARLFVTRMLLFFLLQIGPTEQNLVLLWLDKSYSNYWQVSLPMHG